VDDAKHQSSSALFKLKIGVWHRYGITHTPLPWQSRIVIYSVTFKFKTDIGGNSSTLNRLEVAIAQVIERRRLDYNI
jgi:hypothetical protein